MAIIAAHVNAGVILMVILIGISFPSFPTSIPPPPFPPSLISLMVSVDVQHHVYVDHRQNNSYVKVAGTSPLRSDLCTPLIAVSTAVRSSHKDNVRSTAVEEQLKQKTSPTFWAQLHLPALDLSWALLRIQHHLPPLDLAWTRKWQSNFFVRVQLTRLLLISPGFFVPVSNASFTTCKTDRARALMAVQVCLQPMDAILVMRVGVRMLSRLCLGQRWTVCVPKACRLLACLSASYRVGQLVVLVCLRVPTWCSVL